MAQPGLTPLSLDELTRQLATKNGVNPELAIAVMTKESGGDPTAVGDAGDALGLFQLHEGAAADVGMSPEDRTDTFKNIQGGVQYLGQLRDRYDGDLSKMLQAYNGGMGNVDAGTVSPAASAYADDVMAGLLGGPPAQARTPSPGDVGPRPVPESYTPAMFREGMLAPDPVSGEPNELRSRLLDGVAIATPEESAAFFEQYQHDGWAEVLTGDDSPTGEPIILVNDAKFEDAGAPAGYREAMVLGETLHLLKDRDPMRYARIREVAEADQDFMDWAHESYEYEKSQGEQREFDPWFEHSRFDQMIGGYIFAGNPAMPSLADWKRSELPYGPALSVELDQLADDMGVELTPEPRRVGEDVRYVSEHTLPIAGMILGAFKGGAMGLPAGPAGVFFGAVAGAGVGGIGGEAVNQSIQGLGEFFGLMEPTDRDVVQELIDTGNEGMQLEAFGHGLVGLLAPSAKWVWRRTMQPLRSKLATYADEAMREFPTVGDDVAVLPSEISDSRMLNIMENIAEGSIFGGGQTTAVQATRAGLAEGKVAAKLTTLAPKVEAAAAARESGELVKTSIDDAIANFRRIERPAWEKVRELADPIQLELTPVTDAYIARLTGREVGSLEAGTGVRAARRVANLVGDVAETVPEGRGYLSGQPIAEMAESVQIAVRQAMAETAETVERMTAGEFTNTISKLNTLGRSLRRSAAMDPSKYNAQLGIVKGLIQATREDLMVTLARTSPEAVRAYERATMISRLGNQRLYNKAVNKIAGAEPAKIAEMLLTRNNSTTVNQVTKAVGRQNMQPLRRVALERILRPDAVTKELNWAAIARRLDGIGDDTLTALFPKGQAGDIKQLATLMNNLARTPAGGIGKVGIMLTQWGPLMGLAPAIYTGSVPGGLTVLVGPWMLARIMSSRHGAKYLTRGFEAPLGSPEAMRMAVYLTRLLQQQVEDTPAYQAQQDRAAEQAAAMAPIGRDDDLGAGDQR